MHKNWFGPFNNGVSKYFNEDGQENIEDFLAITLYFCNDFSTTCPHNIGIPVLSKL